MLRNLAKVCAVIAGFFITTNPTVSQTLPPGELGTVTANTPNTWQTFTYTFTPSQTGANFIGFAFRQDPAYWTFDNVTLVVQGTTTNLLTNGDFTTGGSFSVTTSNGVSSIQAPTNWGVWYQNGTYPAAAGTWSQIGGSHGGVWYDGAVGTFDGIYQGVQLTAGTTYTISFEVSGNNTANTSSIQLGIYGGACADVSIAASGCTIPASVGFTTLATPAQGAAAGGPTGPVAVNNPSGTTANNPAGTTTLAVTNAGTYTNDGVNGDVTNTGTFTNNSTGTADNITNAGTFTNAGTVGNITNTGTFTNNGTANDVTNDGTFTNGIMGIIANFINNLIGTNDGTITGNVTNNAAGTFTNNGTIQGSTTNNGTFTNSGTTAGITNAGTFTNTGSTGAVTNNASGTFNNNVGGTTGAVVNAGAWINRGTVATVNNTGTFTNHSTGTTGAFTNSGTLTNAGSIASLNNSGAATNDGVITGNVTNIGTFTNAGTTGAVNNSGTFNSTGTSGVITNSGASTISGNGSITGASNTGTLNITGAANSGDIFNLAGGLLDFNGTGNITNIDNTGVFNVAGSGAVTSIVNSGIVNFNTAGATIGNITNTGVLNLATAGGNFTAAGYSQTNPGLTALAGLQQFNINGPAVLGGSLMIINSPTAFSRYPLMTAQSISGTYDSLVINTSIEPLGAYLKYRDNNVQYYVTPSDVATKNSISIVQNDSAQANNLVTARTSGALNNDCMSGGSMGGCVGFGFGTSKSSTGDLRSGSMIISTKLGQIFSDNYRIGIFLDKPFTNPTMGTVKYKDVGPIVGGFVGWNSNLNGTGLALVGSIARNSTGSYVINRPQLQYSEAGSAVVPVNNTAYQIKGSYSMPVYGSLTATPYLGLRYSNLNVDGYTENGAVFPLSVNPYKQTKTDLLGGLSLGMPITDKISASVSAGLVHNLSNDTGSFSGTSEIYRMFSFDIANPGKKYTSGALGAGVSYEFIPNHKVGVNVGWQQKSLIDANVGSVGMNYTWGF